LEEVVTTFELEALRKPAIQQQVPMEPATACPTCGAELPEGSRFCFLCGRALAATFAPVPGDLVTIAFVDLEGFTTFASDADDEAVREMVLGFHALVRRHVDEHRGFEVKQMGDGFMLAFTSPRRAVACGVDIQRAARRLESHGESIIRVAVGINSGDAIREGDDFFGHTVNVASRIADRADGGQVLVSEATRVLAGHVDGASFRNHGRRRLRGLSGRHRLYQVVWDAA
jgi:class 3 adenylate cyclase